jgi:hypothetical protein
MAIRAWLVGAQDHLHVKGLAQLIAGCDSARGKKHQHDSQKGFHTRWLFDAKT